MTWVVIPYSGDGIQQGKPQQIGYSFPYNHLTGRTQ